MLGASPDAGEAAIKKIVEGLRQSWHPDLATSEADRQLREQRTTQINVAWEILSGKRRAGLSIARGTCGNAIFRGPECRRAALSKHSLAGCEASCTTRSVRLASVQ